MCGEMRGGGRRQRQSVSHGGAQCFACLIAPKHLTISPPLALLLPTHPPRPTSPPYHPPLPSSPQAQSKEACMEDLKWQGLWGWVAHYCCMDEEKKFLNKHVLAVTSPVSPADLIFENLR